jgi:hypothetical protein
MFLLRAHFENYFGPACSATDRASPERPSVGQIIGGLVWRQELIEELLPG